MPSGKGKKGKAEVTRIMWWIVSDRLGTRRRFRKIKVVLNMISN